MTTTLRDSIKTQTHVRRKPVFWWLLRTLTSHYLLGIMAIVLVVIILWTPFGLRRTVGIYEEYAIYQHPANILSRVSLPDPTRPFTEAPFIFAAALTPNSFVGFNIFMMLLFLGKGAALYKLLRYVVPENRGVALIAAMLFIIYPADIGLMSFRAINIHAAIFLTLFAVERLVAYWTWGHKWNWPLIWAIQVCALGIYEISFVMVGLAPLLLLWMQKSLSRRLVFTTAAWFIAPLVMGLRAVWKIKYGPSSYVLQTLDNGAEEGLNLATLIKSLELMYTRHYRGWIHALHQVDPSSPYFIYAVIGAVVVGLIVWAYTAHIQKQPPRLHWRRALWLLVGGLVFMSLGFAPYLASPYREWNFRVFYLTAAGAALAIAIVITFVGQHLRRVGPPVMSAVTSLLVLLALTNALNQQAFFVDNSTDVQRLLAGIVEQVPALQEGSVLVFVDEFNEYQDQWHFAGSSPYLERALNFLYEDDTLTVRICALHVDRPARYCVFYPDRITHVWRGVEELETFYYKDMIVVRMTPYGTVEIVDSIPNDWVEPSAGGDAENLLATYNPLPHLVPGASLPRRAKTFFTCWPIERCFPPVEWITPQTEVSLGFDQPIRGMGWEGYRKGMAQTWTTLETASLFLQLVPQNDYVVQFTIASSIAPDILDSLSLSVNQTPIPLEHFQNEYGGSTFSGVISKAVIEADPKVTRLDFHTNRVIAPVSIGLGPDVRTLGVLFDELAITPIPSEVHLEFDEPILGDGWWMPERLTMWTSSPASTINLHLATSQALALEIGVAYYIASDVLESLVVEVNGEAIPLERQLTADGIYVYRGVIPPTALARGAANRPVLTFKINRVASPASLGINEDIRELGLLLDWLTVQPVSKP